MKFSLLVSLPLALALTSCGSGGSPSVPLAVATATASKAPLPVATGKPVVVLHALAGRAGDARLDMAGLDAMSSKSADIYEPFVKKTVHFEGVPLGELLSRAGITSGSIHIHALDDYTFDGKVADFVADGALLATKANGRAIPVAEGGPIRIVFDTTNSLAKNTDAWVWSVDSMRQDGPGS